MTKDNALLEVTQAARLFHDTYERLAPSFGYETRPDTKLFDPNSPNGKLMIAVCGEVLARLQSTEQRLGQDADGGGVGEALVYVPGVWRCPKCEFRLIQSNLNAFNGTVTARDEPGDKCPNCASPLWRVTYRDELAEANVLWEQQVERAVAAESALAALQAERDRLREALTGCIPVLVDMLSNECVEEDECVAIGSYPLCGWSACQSAGCIVDKLKRARAALNPNKDDNMGGGE